MIETNNSLASFLADERAIERSIPSSFTEPAHRYLSLALRRVNAQDVTLTMQAPELMEHVLTTPCYAAASLLGAACSYEPALAHELCERAQTIFMTRARAAEERRAKSAWAWGELADRTHELVARWQVAFRTYDSVSTTSEHRSQGDGA